MQDRNDETIEVGQLILPTLKLLRTKYVFEAESILLDLVEKHRGAVMYTECKEITSLLMLKNYHVVCIRDIASELANYVYSKNCHIFSTEETATWSGYITTSLRKGGMEVVAL